MRKNRWRNVDTKKKRVAELREAGPHLTASEIAQALGFNKHTVGHILYELKNPDYYHKKRKQYAENKKSGQCSSYDKYRVLRRKDAPKRRQCLKCGEWFWTREDFWLCAYHRRQVAEEYAPELAQVAW